MKITYTFCNETVEIEVPDTWGAIVIELNRIENNINRKETRRHFSIDSMEYESCDYEDEHDYFAGILGEKSIEDCLPDAIATLEPQQRELLHKIFFEGRKKIDIASEEGVSCASISRRLERIYKKIKLFLK